MIEPAKSLINQITNVNRTLYHRFDLLEGVYTYQYLIESLDIIFYAHMKPADSRLTIMLPGAVNRAKILHNFQRYSWSNDIQGSVISFLDPTITTNNNLTIGWFQGNENTYAMPILVEFIKKLLETNNIAEKDLTIFGSSAGGFSSLKIAESFPNSRIVVINPQTRIFNYSPREYSKLVNWIFPKLTVSEATNKYKDRLSIQLNLNQRTRAIHYFQNIDDGHHVQHHLNPLLSTLSKEDYSLYEGIKIQTKGNSMLKVYSYSDPVSKHSPLGKNDTLAILNS